MKGIIIAIIIIILIILAVSYFYPSLIPLGIW